MSTPAHLLLSLPATVFPDVPGAAVATYTVASLLAVLMTALVISLVLRFVELIGLLPSHRSFLLRQRLRTLFGASFLLALIPPFVALHFSMTSLIVFVGASGILITAWVWAATPPDLDLDMGSDALG